MARLKARATGHVSDDTGKPFRQMTNRNISRGQSAINRDPPSCIRMFLLALSTTRVWNSLTQLEFVSQARWFGFCLRRTVKLDARLAKWWTQSDFLRVCPTVKVNIHGILVRSKMWRKKWIGMGPARYFTACLIPRLPPIASSHVTSSRRYSEFIVERQECRTWNKRPKESTQRQLSSDHREN